MTTYCCKLHSQATDLTITFLIQNYAREAKLGVYQMQSLKRRHLTAQLAVD